MTKNELMLKPLISAKTLESLACVEQENWQEVFIFWLAQAAGTMIDNFDFFLNHKKFYLAAATSTAPENFQKIFEAALNELEQNIKKAIEDTRRVFLSESDVINHIIKGKFIPAALLKAMLDGKWPKHPFNFDSIDRFRIIRGTLVPDDGTGEPAPGPDFKLVMVNDPTE